MSNIISEIKIYPIKSLGGISIAQSRAMYAGFQYDRRWMLLDEDFKFITQRDIPQLALFRPSIEEDKLMIQYRDEVFTVNTEQGTKDKINTKVWDDTAETLVVGDRANEWFSDMLGRKVYLVKIQSENGRSHHNKNRNVNLPVSLADGYPYLIVGSASLDLLNSKLTHPVTMDRFRPNIILDTIIPHNEDTWDKCRTSNVNFLNMKPCGRCSVVTIDQNTASINNETLKVLNTYRKSGNSVLFGTNMMCTNEGLIKVGDIFYT